MKKIQFQKSASLIIITHLIPDLKIIAYFDKLYHTTHALYPKG
jgi:hypothetical protein